MKREIHDYRGHACDGRWTWRGLAGTIQVVAGDILFGLEVVRRNLCRLLSFPELACHLLRLGPPPDVKHGRSGLLVISLGKLGVPEPGLGSRESFFQVLRQREKYALKAVQPGSTVYEVLEQIAGEPLPQPQRRFAAAIHLARGQRVIHADLGSRLQWAAQDGLERDLRWLYKQAHRSGFRHYEVVLYGGAYSAKHPGFLLLPSYRLTKGNSPAAGPECTSERTMRIVTWNVHSCVGLDGRYDPARILSILRRLEPDVIALQEVDVRRKRSRYEDQVRMFTESLGMTAAFCATVQRPEEVYGHLLLSRFPLETLHDGTIDTGSTRFGERRGALLARIAFGTSEIFVLNTHLGLSPVERLQQAEALVGPGWLGKAPANRPAIFCGDFNAGSGSPPHEVLAAHLRDAAEGQKLPGTFPSPLPCTRIDHVFVSKHFHVSGLEVTRMMAAEAGSDHLPLVVDLALLDR